MLFERSKIHLARGLNAVGAFEDVKCSHWHLQTRTKMVGSPTTCAGLKLEHMPATEWVQSTPLQTSVPALPAKSVLPDKLPSTVQKRPEVNTTTILLSGGKCSDDLNATCFHSGLSTIFRRCFILLILKAQLPHQDLEPDISLKSFISQVLNNHTYCLLSKTIYFKNLVLSPFYELTEQLPLIY